MHWRTRSTGMGLGGANRLAQANIDEMSLRLDEILLLVLDGGDASGLRELVAHASGLRVREAGSLDRAVERLADARTVAAVVDAEATPLRGVGPAVAELRRAAGVIPVVVLDRADAPEREATALHAGADVVVAVDTADAESLAATLTAAIERRAAAQAVADVAEVAGDSAIAEAVQARAGDRGVVTIVSVQIDERRVLLDRIGGDEGDALTLAAALRVRSVLRPHDALLRIAEDRLCVVRRDRDELAAAAFADRLLVATRQPLAVAGDRLTSSASIGLALATRGSDPEEVLLQARRALVRAQARGGGCYELFDEQMRERVLGNRQMEVALRHAIEQREFHVYYQPVVDLASHRVLSFEALVRWHRPDAGTVYPATFVETAQRSGLMTRIGAAVLMGAARQAQGWPGADGGDAPPGVSVNLSPLELLQPNVVAMTAGALRATGLEARRLLLEFPVTLLTTDAESVRGVLRSLHELGVTLVADDVDGASITDDLLDLPIDMLKLRMDLVRDLDAHEHRRETVTAIMRRAASRGWSVVAKGVESETQAAALTALGCGAGQGFLFSDARPGADLAGAFHRGAAWRAEPGAAQAAHATR